ncbi:MAG: diguanylate cyclase [Pseudomonadota bacterium]|nr:diguanylate cyclase [Pseudomonadota bacterium]
MDWLPEGAEAMRAILESDPDGIAVIDFTATVVLHNTRYAELWGFVPEQLTALRAEQRWAWQARQIAPEQEPGADIAFRVESGIQSECVVFRMLDGRWMERRLYDHRTPGGKMGLVVRWRDITALHEANRLARHERELMHSLMDSIPDQIFFKDLDSRFIRINPSLALRYGIAHPAEAVGKSDADFYSAEHAARTRADEVEIMRSGKPLLRQVLLERWPDGSETWNMCTKMPLRDARGALIGIYGIAHDITEHKRTEALIWQQANFDALTELPNRRLLRDRWLQAASLRERSGQLLALLVLDLDRFKAVNDTLGHARGDELLVKVASRLRECVRASDTVARLGGDEFALILNGLPDASQVEQRAGCIIAALARPFEIAGITVDVSASAGIALCPRDGDQLEQLFLHADRAMYCAKSGGRNRVHWHAPG